VALRRAHADGVSFDLAIIDAQMPNRDGFDLAAAVQADAAIAGTRLCMLTSAGERGDAQRCRDLAIQGYLTKPISRIDLLEAVSLVLATAKPDSVADVVTRHTIREARRELKILLAEDNPVNQEVAAVMLRKRGHHVDIVDNGREAVEAVQRDTYDVVLMDIQMPVMDGRTATVAIRALPLGLDLPIFAVTAHALNDERARCEECGMNGYLAKPFKAHELYALVEGWTEPKVADADALACPVPVAAPPPLAAVVDLEGFRGTMREAGVEEAVAGILRMFASSAPERLEALGVALQAGDGPAIGRAAHAFKSAASTIGARGLAGQLLDMESAAGKGDVARATGQMPALRDEVDAVLTYLQHDSDHVPAGC
jgi:CheY-like chemotaxis protein